MNMRENKGKKKEPVKRVYCKSCLHYYITWDKRFPNGCRFWGIKSSHLPSVTVYRSNGTVCEYHQKNEPIA